MKKIFLSIPEPCHEDWDQMITCEKGKFCNSCQKTVIDFTNMSDRQLAAFFKNAPASLCGQIHTDQLNRFIDIPRKRIPWVRYFFQFTLPAFLIFFKAYSQKNLRYTTFVEKTSSKNIKSEEPETKSFRKIEGTITDTSGEPIPYVTIKLKNSTGVTTSDASGKFFIQTTGQSPVLLLTAIGYEAQQIEVKSPEPLHIIMTIKNSVMGEVVIMSNNYLRGKISGAMSVGRVINEPGLIKKLIDTLSAAFSVYPNPVAKGSSFKIKLNRMTEGEYQLSILDVKGSVVRSSDMIINNKKDSIGQESFSFSAGIYFVRITNKKSGASFTQKLIIQ